MPKRRNSLEGGSRKPYKPARIDLTTSVRVAQNLAASDFVEGKQVEAATSRALRLTKIMMWAGSEENRLGDIMGWFLGGVRTRITTFLPEGARLGRLKLWIAGGRTIEGGKTITPDTDLDLMLSFEGSDEWKSHLNDAQTRILERQFKELVVQLNAKLLETRLMTNERHIVDVLGVGHMLSDADAERRSARTDKPLLAFATEAL